MWWSHLVLHSICSKYVLFDILSIDCLSRIFHAIYRRIFSSPFDSFITLCIHTRTHTLSHAHAIELYVDMLSISISSVNHSFAFSPFALMISSNVHVCFRIPDFQTPALSPLSHIHSRLIKIDRCKMKYHQIPISLPYSYFSDFKVDYLTMNEWVTGFLLKV